MAVSEAQLSSSVLQCLPSMPASSYSLSQRMMTRRRRSRRRCSCAAGARRPCRAWASRTAPSSWPPTPASIRKVHLGTLAGRPALASAQVLSSLFLTVASPHAGCSNLFCCIITAVLTRINSFCRHLGTSFSGCCASRSARASSGSR